MWFWPVNKTIELLSVMPAPQFGDESSWVRGSDPNEGSKYSVFRFHWCKMFSRIRRRSSLLYTIHQFFLYIIHNVIPREKIDTWGSFRLWKDLLNLISYLLEHSWNSRRPIRVGNAVFSVSSKEIHCCWTAKHSRQTGSGSSFSIWPLQRCFPPRLSSESKLPATENFPLELLNLTDLNSLKSFP
jgi:hypothetical protein